MICLLPTIVPLHKGAYVLTMNHSKNSIFERIAEYWSEELNNEVYFQGKQSPFERGSKEYFDYIIQQRETYLLLPQNS